MAKVTFYGYVSRHKIVHEDILITVAIADPDKNLNQLNNGDVRSFHLPAISKESADCPEIYRLAVATCSDDLLKITLEIPDSSGEEPKILELSNNRLRNCLTPKQLLETIKH